MIESKEDWWKFLDTHWDEMICLFQEARFPLGGQAHSDMLDHNSCLEGGTGLDHITRLKKNKDPLLGSYLNRVWFLLPDRESTRHLPGFFNLCTLCEEVGELYEQEPLKEIT